MRAPQPVCEWISTQSTGTQPSTRQPVLGPLAPRDQLYTTRAHGTQDGSLLNALGFHLVRCTGLVRGIFYYYCISRYLFSALQN